ncbi:MAG TPA: hypothetical protein VK934_12760 [Fimbriimonas sp.]|nr:hypothetical protein [Fimbriimonas sp.]
MSKWKLGERVRVVSRAVSAEDRKNSRYYEHMAGLTGTVQQIYSESEVAVEVEPESLSKVSGDVHKTATLRMREKFLSQISEEQKKQFTKEELDFDAHYVLLVQSSDLEKA